MNKPTSARHRACVVVAASASIGLLGSTLPAPAPAAAAGASASVTPLGLSQASSGVDDPDPVPVTDGSEVLQGKPMSPTGDVKEAKARQADAREDAGITAQAASEDITGFSLSAAYPKAVAPGQRPYEDFALSDPKGFGLVDSSGVRVFRFAGETKIWQHPVAQIQYGLINLNSYRLTKNRAYLDIAIANAQRNIDRKVESAGAWYFPYDFDFAVHGDTTETLKAPWYSAMAQGQALSLFVRLYEYTKDAKWKAAADATFASLRQAPAARRGSTGAAGSGSRSTPGTQSRTASRSSTATSMRCTACMTTSSSPRTPRPSSCSAVGCAPSRQGCPTASAGPTG